LAKRRGVDRATLQRQLRGDLDWIAMKSLEKDRTRRYGSPRELAADIGRYLSHQPVLASPPSAAYRARKFVRRHRLGVGSAAAGVLVLLAFAGTMAVQAGRIARERDRVKMEAETSHRVSEFLVDLFEVSDPNEARGNKITAREILDRGAEKIERELADQPVVQATLKDTMGRVYKNLGLFGEGRQLLESAVETRRRLFGETSLEVASSLHSLGFVAMVLMEFDAAERHVRQSLAIRRELLGTDDLEVAASLHLLGEVLTGKRLFGSEVEPPEALLEEALAIRRKLLGDEHTLVAQTLSELGYTYLKQGDLKAVEPLLLEAATLQQRLLGGDHPDTISNHQYLGQLYAKKGEYAAAEQFSRRAREAAIRVIGERSTQAWAATFQLADALEKMGQLEEAAELKRWALRLTREGTDEWLPEPMRMGVEGFALLALASVEQNLGDLEKAERHFREALPVWREQGHASYIGSALERLGILQGASGRQAAAEQDYREAMEILRDVDSVPPTQYPGVVLRLAELAERQGRVDEARELYTEALSRLQGLPESRFRAERHARAQEEVLLGSCLLGLGRYVDAEPLLARSVTEYQLIYGKRDFRVGESLNRVVRLYQAWGKPDKAEEYRAMVHRTGEAIAAK
jgi:tetratricopeptide (TPR) repeat protein